MKPHLYINQETDDFIRFIEKQSVYIDRSLLIKDILMFGHMHITAPPRWGKSLNLSMIRAFFKTDGDDPTHYHKNGKYDFSRGNKHEKCFQKLKIAGEKLYLDLQNGTIIEDIMQEYQGKFPVIFLNFKRVENFENEEEFEMNLRSVVSIAYHDHEYFYTKELRQSIKIYKMVQEGFNLSNEEIENSETELLESIVKKFNIYLHYDLKRFQAYFNGEIRKEAPLEDSISFLCKILYKFYNKEVLILVDDFDKPVISILRSFMESMTNFEASKKHRKLMKHVSKRTSNLISRNIKGEAILFKVILTGIFNTLSYEGKLIDEIPTAVNYNGWIIPKYYGFDDADIQTIFNLVLKEEIDTNLRQKLKDKLEYWYKGQNICCENVYTPSSVMEYFRILNNSKIMGGIPKFMPFWEMSQTTNLVKVILKEISREESLNFDGYLELLKDIAIGKNVYLQFNPSKSFISEIEDFDYYQDLEVIFSHILIKTGYLTVKNEAKTFGYPANEVKGMIDKIIMKTWCKKLIFKENWHKFKEIAKNTDFFNMSENTENIGKAINLVNTTDNMTIEKNKDCFESVDDKNSRDENIRKLLNCVKNEEKEKAFQEIQNLIANKGENLKRSDIMEFKYSVKGIGKTTKEALCEVIFGTNSKKRKLELSPLVNEKKVKNK